jgi:hypothetical protein
VAGFSEYEFALKFRDTIKKIVKEILDQERPQPKVGRVVDLDRASGIAYVVYPGNDDTAMKVRVYPGTQPLNSDRLNGDEQGSVVRVAGTLGSRYIAEVLSTGKQLMNPRLFRAAFAGGGSGDTTVRNIFSFNSPSVPPADGSNLVVATFLFPNLCGRARVYLELASDTDGWNLYSDIPFDQTTTKNSLLNWSGGLQSSAGMLASMNYTITADPGGLLVEFGITRSASSTRTPTRTAIDFDMAGANVTLVSVGDTFV